MRVEYLLGLCMIVAILTVVPHPLALAQTNEDPTAANEKNPCMPSYPDWKNPVIGIERDGILIVPDTKRYNVEQFEQKLLALPDSAWPCGKVVEIGEQAIVSGNDVEVMNEYFKAVIKVLATHGIKINLLPSN